MMDAARWKQIKEIFHPAIELSGDERMRFVDESCGEDPELRDEVLALLASHDEPQPSIDNPSHTVTDFVAGLSDENMVGKQIGAYRIEREIGRGGMGSVFLARRADEEFYQVVAIKLIKRGFDTDEIISRFKHERRILAALDHPYITRLFDGGTTEDGRPYLVMEYVEGLPLTKYCDEKRLGIEERLKLFLKVCSALLYAHSSLVIHRDLKPSNILVTADGNPKLLDFGVAKLLTPERFDTVGTVHGSRAMTPCYASPEQIDNKKITVTSDVYSLGVVLYELLSGRLPFKFQSMRVDEISKTLAEIPPTWPSAAVVRSGELVSPEAVAAARGISIERLRRKLFGDLDTIVLMAIRKEPERRYASPLRFAEDIENYLQGRPIAGRKDSLGYRTAKFVQRNKAGVAAGVGIAATLIGGLIAVSRQARKAQRERDRAIAAARRVENINRFAKKVMGSAQPGNRGKDVRFIEVMAEMEEALERDLGEQPEEMGELLSTLGLTYLSLGIFDKAENCIRKSLQIRSRIYPRRTVPVAESFWNFAKLQHAKGLLKEAEPYYLEAEEIFLECRGPLSVTLAAVKSDFGHLLALTGRHQESIDKHQEALAIRRRGLGNDHPDVAMSLGETGNVLAMMMGRYEESIPYQREALRILQRFHRGDHPDIAKTYLYLGSAVHRIDPSAAIGYAKEAHTIRLRLFDPSHPDVAWANYNIGYYLVREGKGAEAIHHAKAVIREVGSGLPKEHAVVSSTYLMMGRGFLLEKDYDQAMRAFDECLSLRRATLPEDHWLIATVEGFKGYTLALSGRVADGVDLMAASAATLVEKLGDEHAQTKEALERLSEFQPA